MQGHSSYYNRGNQPHGGSNEFRSNEYTNHGCIDRQTFVRSPISHQNRHHHPRCHNERSHEAYGYSEQYGNEAYQKELSGINKINRVENLRYDRSYYQPRRKLEQSNVAGIQAPCENDHLENYTDNLEGYATANEIGPMINLEEHIVDHEIPLESALDLHPDMPVEEKKPSLMNEVPPRLIKKSLDEPAATYKQSVWIKYLKPPRLPVPGPIIIKEIREKQQPQPPPIIIRQKPEIPRTPPPLILREKPPCAPRIPKTQVLIKRIPPPPPKPRQVIVERYPPLPPKPRDIIIEKWLPYAAPPKRKVIVHRAPPPKVEEPTRNLIIQYVAKNPEVMRCYKNLGIDEVNPEMYEALYRSQLLDPNCLKHAAAEEGILDVVVSF
ncbi:hypothetical protein ACOME3_005598 [Neoechinorhynchus agilis]